MKAEPNDNLVSCEAPTTPVDNDDTTPFDEFVKWYRQGGDICALAKTIPD